MRGQGGKITSFYDQPSRRYQPSITLTTCFNVYYCDPDAKALAYLSLIRPLLEYAAAAWDPYRIRDIHIDTLEMVQRRAARFAKHDYRRTTSVTKLLGELDWPVLSDSRREARLSLFSKPHQSLCPSYG